MAKWMNILIVALAVTVAFSLQLPSSRESGDDGRENDVYNSHENIEELIEDTSGRKFRICT